MDIRLRKLALLLVALVAIAGIITGITYAAIFTDWAIREIGKEEPQVLSFAMVDTAEAYVADYICDGTDDYVQWQAAVNALTDGGQIDDLCGTTYDFSGGTVTMPRGDIVIRGRGNATFFSAAGNNSHVVWSDGGNSEVIFECFGTDGNLTVSSGSCIENCWVAGTFVNTCSNLAGCPCGDITSVGNVEIFACDYSAINQGAWVLDGDNVPATSYIGRIYNSTHADADELDFTAYFADGTYELIFVHTTASTNGIVDIDIDGGEIASFDTYSVAQVRNGRGTDAGNAITAGAHTITVRVDGKNGASTNHYAIWNKICFRRTA